MNLTEAAAHLDVVTAIESHLDDRISWHAMLAITEAPLRSFRARCNCGAVLRVGRWVQGRRFIRCPQCQAKWAEFL